MTGFLAVAKKYVTDRDLGMRAIMREYRRGDGLALTVGIQQGETNEGVSVAEYGAYNEYGTDKIPQRSFMGTAFDENKAGYIRYMTRASKAIGLQSFANMATTLGLKAQQDIQNVITKRNILPKLADSTVKAKGDTKTLVDTGALANSITFITRRK